jgi:hypothetical protein
MFRASPIERHLATIAEQLMLIASHLERRGD